MIFKINQNQPNRRTMWGEIGPDNVGRHDENLRHDHGSEMGSGLILNLMGCVSCHIITVQRLGVRFRKYRKSGGSRSEPSADSIFKMFLKTILIKPLQLIYPTQAAIWSPGQKSMEYLGFL